MSQAKFIATLNELIDQIIKDNVEVKTSKNENVKIIEHNPNMIKIQLPDSSIKSIILYSSSYNFCFFDHYKISSPKIINEYNAAKTILEEEIKAEKAAKKAEKEAARIAAESLKKSTHRATKRNSKSVTYSGFNQDDFIDFILSQISPATNELYANSSAIIYNREICKILDSGVSFDELSKDIDKYIFDYTDENGCMKKENEAQHANPSSALVLLKKYIDRP